MARNKKLPAPKGSGLPKTRTSGQIAKRGNAVGPARPYTGSTVAKRVPKYRGWIKQQPKKGLPNMAGKAANIASKASRAPGWIGVAALVAGVLADQYVRRQQQRTQAAENRLADAYKSATGRSIAQSSVMGALKNRRPSPNSGNKLKAALSAVSASTAKPPKASPSKPKPQPVKPKAEPKNAPKKTSTASMKAKKAKKAKAQAIIAKDRARADSWTWNSGKKPSYSAPKTASKKSPSTADKVVKWILDYDN